MIKIICLKLENFQFLLVMYPLSLETFYTIISALYGRTKLHVKVCGNCSIFCFLKPYNFSFLLCTFFSFLGVFCRWLYNFTFFLKNVVPFQYIIAFCRYPCMNFQDNASRMPQFVSPRRLLRFLQKKNIKNLNLLVLFLLEQCFVRGIIVSIKEYAFSVFFGSKLKYLYCTLALDLSVFNKCFCCQCYYNMVHHPIKRKIHEALEIGLSPEFNILVKPRN